MNNAVDLGYGTIELPDAPVPYNAPTHPFDVFTCEGAPGWLLLPAKDVGKTPGELFDAYSKEGFRGLRVKRFRPATLRR